MHNRKKNVLLMYGIALLQGMVFYGPIATLYRTARGVTIYQITLIEGASLLFLLLLEIPWGFVSDRIGYKRTLVLSNAVYFVSKFIFYQAQGFGAFLAERLLLSVALSGLSGCDSAYLHAVTAPEERPRVFGIYEAACYAGLLLAAVLYSAVMVGDHAMTALCTMAAYGIALGLTLCLTEVPRPAREGKGAQVRDALRAILHDAKFLPFLLGAALLRETGQTLTVFLTQLQYVRAALPAGLFGAAYIAQTAAHLSCALTGKLLKRVSRRRVAFLCFGASALACVMLCLTRSAFLSVLAIVVLCAATSLFAPLALATQDERVQSVNRAGTLSIYSAVMNLSAIGTSLTFGKLAEISLPLAFGAGAILCCAGFLLSRPFCAR